MQISAYDLHTRLQNFVQVLFGFNLITAELRHRMALYSIFNWLFEMSDLLNVHEIKKTRLTVCHKVTFLILDWFDYSS